MAARAVEHDVGRLEQRGEPHACLGAREVHGHEVFGCVEVGPSRGADPRVAGPSHRLAPRGIAARRLDADHLGAETREPLPREGAGAAAAQLDDAHAGQRAVAQDAAGRNRGKLISSETSSKVTVTGMPM
jgi:hypothetical protein